MVHVYKIDRISIDLLRLTMVTKTYKLIKGKQTTKTYNDL